MRTKRATVEEVKAKLKAVKRRKLEEKQKVGNKYHCAIRLSNLDRL